MPARVAFAWRPFELNPDMPAEGVERKAYRAGNLAKRAAPSSTAR